jgi:anti-sigma-K factor RskA
MDLGRRDRRRRLELVAAEYVLGTLPPRARARLQHIAAVDRTVAQAIDEWEQRLSGLAAAVPAVAPPPQVWDGIVMRLGLRDPNAVPASKWWARMPFWRAFAIASFAGLMVLGVGTLVSQRETPGVIVVMLAGPDAKPMLVVSAPRRDRVLRVKALNPIAIASGRSLELWLLPAQGNPKPLGLLDASGTVTLPLTSASDEFLAGAKGLAVSLEPAGGSPTGQPTGPILYTGKIETI